MKKLIFAITFLGFTFQVQSQEPLLDMLKSKKWMNISSRQLSTVKIEHQNYDLVLMPEKKVDMFWGDVIKLDTINNYRDSEYMRCGTPPYSHHNIIGKWQVEKDTLCIDIQSAILDCTYEEEKCKKLEQEFLKRKEETRIKYALEVINDSVIAGIKLELK